MGVKLSEPIPEDSKDGFNAYVSMADRIKLKRRERLAKEAKIREGVCNFVHRAMLSPVNCYS